MNVAFMDISWFAAIMTYIQNQYDWTKVRTQLVSFFFRYVE